MATIEFDSKVQEFKDNFLKHVNRDYRVSDWHLKLHEGTDGEVELPYNPTEDWVYATVGEYGYVSTPTEDDPDKKTYQYTADVDASLKRLSLIAKFAAKEPGVQGVEKKYRDDTFELVVTLADDIKIRYNVKREVICTKRVVGTKVIAATPERTVDEVEWDCKPISLLGFNPENASE